MITDPAPGAETPSAPPTGAALAERLDAIRAVTVDRVRRRARAGLAARLAVAGAGAAVLVVAVILVLVSPTLTRGIGPAPIAGTSASPAPSTRDTSLTADATAAELLSEIAVPGSARRQSTSPDPKLDQPPQGIACTPSYDSSKWFTVADMAPQALLSWLEAHNGSLATIGGAGTSGTASKTDRWFAVGDLSGSYPNLLRTPQILMTVVAVGAGSGLRLDAQTVPTGASCNSTGVATPPPASVSP